MDLQRPNLLLIGYPTIQITTVLSGKKQSLVQFFSPTCKVALLLLVQGSSVCWYSEESLSTPISSVKMDMFTFKIYLIGSQQSSDMPNQKAISVRWGHTVGQLLLNAALQMPINIGKLQGEWTDLVQKHGAIVPFAKANEFMKKKEISDLMYGVGPLGVMLILGEYFPLRSSPLAYLLFR